MIRIEGYLVPFDRHNLNHRRLPVRACLEKIADLDLLDGQSGSIHYIDLRFVAKSIALLGTDDHRALIALAHFQELRLETFDDIVRTLQKAQRALLWGLIEDVSLFVAKREMEADNAFRHRDGFLADIRSKSKERPNWTLRAKRPT